MHAENPCTETLATHPGRRDLTLEPPTTRHYPSVCVRTCVCVCLWIPFLLHEKWIGSMTRPLMRCERAGERASE